MTWRELVRRELARYRAETGTEFVERREFLDVALPAFREAYPEASTPAQTFSRVMQELRDRGEVDFHAPGTYRILDLDVEDAEATAGREAGSRWKPESEPSGKRAYSAREYETTVGARSMPAAFREYVLDRYGHRCPVSGVDHDALLDVAHVLPWSEYPEHRADPSNVLPLSRTEHAAFDAGVFTLDAKYRLRVDPAFETESDVLRRALLDRAGERVDVPEDALDAEYLAARNETVEWW